MPHVDHVLAVSGHTAKDIRRYLTSLRIPEPPITITKNGSSFEEFLPKRERTGEITILNLPERFGLEYTGADNAAHRPTMLHRVLVGSMERFVGGLIEHYAGAFPLWLAPEQGRVIPIADDLKEFAKSVVERLKARGVRVHLDDRSDTLNYRIREGEMMKIPYMAVVGKREAESDSVAVRVRGAGKKQEIMTVADFTARLEDELATRALKP